MEDCLNSIDSDIDLPGVFIKIESRSWKKVRGIDFGIVDIGVIGRNR